MTFSSCTYIPRHLAVAGGQEEIVKPKIDESCSNLQHSCGTGV